MAIVESRNSVDEHTGSLCWSSGIRLLILVLRLARAGCAGGHWGQIIVVLVIDLLVKNPVLANIDRKLRDIRGTICFRP